MENTDRGFIIPLALVIVAILVIGGGTYFYEKNTSKNNIEVSESNTNTESSKDDISLETPQKPAASSSQGTTQKVTFSNFIKQGGPYICNVSRYIDRESLGDAKMSGTAYVNEGIIRVDYGPNMLSLIYKDNKTYWWWGTSNPNYKYDPNEGHIEESASSTYSWNSEAITDYDCKAWTLDNSKFVVPSNLNFSQKI